MTPPTVNRFPNELNLLKIELPLIVGHFTIKQIYSNHCYICISGSYQWKSNGTAVQSTNLPIVYFNSEFRVNGTLDESLLYLFTREVS